MIVIIIVVFNTIAIIHTRDIGMKMILFIALRNFLR